MMANSQAGMSASAVVVGTSQEYGEPLAWYVAQVRDNLAGLLTEGGYGEVVPKIDLAEISAHAGDIEKAMEDCVPAGYVRTPGVGLQRQPA